MNENFEKLAQLIDDLDNLAHSILLPMSADFHIENLKRSLPGKVKLLKHAFAEATGEDPWEFHPDDDLF